MRRKSTRHQNRSAGFALISILSFGIASILMILALLPLILNVVRSESANKHQGELRLAAGIGIDYAMKALNESQPGQCLLGASPTAVPSAYLDGFPDMTVMVRVKTISKTVSPIDWNHFTSYSSIYSTSLDSDFQNKSVANQSYLNAPIFNIQNGSYWRVIESSAKRNGFARTIRVFAEPIFNGSSTRDQDLGYLPASKNYSSYFQKPLMGNASILIDGPISVNSIEDPGDPSLLEIQSNQSIQVNPNNTSGTPIKGSLLVSNGYDGVPAQVGTVGTNSLIGGTVTANGTLTIDQTSMPATQPTYNTNPGTAIDQVVLAPAPRETATQPIENYLGDSLSTGSYSATSIDTSNGTSTIGTDSQVKIYVQDGLTTNTNAISINSSQLKNTGPSENLQIWYNGTRPVDINLNEDFNGLVYAPNAPITIHGLKNFKGALVGQSIELKNKGSVSINTSLRSLNQDAKSSGGLTYTDARSTTGEPLPIGYRAVTWQEIPGALVH